MEILVYELYGHYSFNARDGGEPVRLALADGYAVGPFANGVKMILGSRMAVSVEEAIYHGFARVITA